jgi:signal peptidase I
MVTTDNPLEDGTPRLAESSAAVPEDVISLLDPTGTPAAPEGRAPVVQEPTPVAADDTPAVAAGDLFVAAEKSTPRTSGRSRSKPPNVAKAIRTVIAYILLLAVLGAAGICAFSLVQGTWMATPVLSGSMRPGLSVGGVVVSQRVTVESLHVRDVIIFRDPYKPSEQIVHRIVKISKGPGGKLLFNTQGDANNVRDPWTLSIEGDSIYRARWSVPLVGYVAIAYQNHRGFFLLGAGILLILIAITTFFEERQRRQRRHSRRPAHAP